MIAGVKSFPPSSSGHVASLPGNFFDTTTTDETDESSADVGSPRAHGVVASAPHYQFHKSNSMKLALREDEDGGRLCLAVEHVCHSEFPCFADNHRFVLTVLRSAFSVSRKVGYRLLWTRVPNA